MKQRELEERINMGRYRKDRINEAVQTELAQIIRDVKDPRVSGALITITGAEVTPDLKYAKIFYSVLGVSDEEEKKELVKGLRKASGYMRSRLAQSLNLRVTPELNFIEDTSIAHGMKIAAILNSLDLKDEDEEEENTDEDND